MKAIIVVVDGMADRPLKALGGKTPLEAARKPQLDSLAGRGITGILDPISPGIRAGSDTSHLAILGYNPYSVYTGRGPYEALGMGLDLEEGDVAFRCNFATVDEDFRVIDRRAGRIEDTRELEKAIKEEIELPVAFDFASLEYRSALVLRGLNTHRVTDIDPHREGGEVEKPEALEVEAEKTAQVLWEFTTKAHQVLREHPLNRDREPPANILLPRGGGTYLPLENFQQRHGLRGSCIATTAIIKGIARSAGFEVAEPRVGYSQRMGQALEELGSRDLVLMNIKEADEAGHDGLPEEKRRLIESIDSSLEELLEFTRENFLVLLSDHSTPCDVGDHAGDTVPVLIAGPGVRADGVESFDERSCSQGGLSRIRARHIMPILLDLMNRSEKYGA